MKRKTPQMKKKRRNRKEDRRESKRKRKQFKLKKVISNSILQPVLVLTERQFLY